MNQFAGISQETKYIVGSRELARCHEAQVRHYHHASQQKKASMSTGRLSIEA